MEDGYTSPVVYHPIRRPPVPNNFWLTNQTTMDSSSDDESLRVRREEDRPSNSVAGREGQIRSDQFDVRINCDRRDMKWMRNVMQAEFNTGTLKYGHISELELGDDPKKSSYKKHHVHIALCYRHRSTKLAVLKKYAIKGKSWYCEPRDKKLPIAGWISYHSKTRSKVDDAGLYFNVGILPNDKRQAPRSLDSSDDVDIDPKIKKRAKQWKRRKELILKQDWEQLDAEFPGFIYTTQGKNMKIELIKKQPRPPTLKGKLNNYIIWGPTGTGKSSSVSYLGYDYKKQKGSQYWDHYDQAKDYTENGNVVWIDEMSKETLECFAGKLNGGFEMLKELADREPVMVDAKYLGSFYIRPKQIIITMNEHPSTLLPDRAPHINGPALFRKFQIVPIWEWLSLHNLRCTTKGVEPIPFEEVEEDGSDTTDIEPIARNLGSQERSTKDN